MVKCAGCGKFLSAIGAVSCGQCPSYYHKACVGLSEHAQLPKKWKCPECKAKIPKVGNIDTPIKDTSTSFTEGDTSNISMADLTPKTSLERESLSENVSDIAQPLELGLEIRLFRDELQQLRKELKEFRADLSDIRGAIAVCNQRINEFDGRLLTLENEVKVTNRHECTETVKLEEIISQLKEELNDRDQDLLQADIEISNLPEISGENPHHTVTVLATKLGLDLNERDIIFAERVGKKSESDSQAAPAAARGRRMVVRLSQRNLRDDFLRSARTRRGVTTEGLGLDSSARRFYVNERLTRRNRQLFYQARERAKQMQWRYTWTKRGRIYARQADGKSAHQIKSEYDLERVFSNISVGLNKI